ncbi:MAG: hypothetical protein M1819_002824 [Sarea resinae]|nr:MAG: hypothetical protein M1819_002824 [Sarea resinae]
MTSTPKRVPIPRNGVDYRGKVVLAPMVRSGELPSRLLALKYGADLVWGPETVDRALIGTTRRINPTTSTIDFTRLPSNGSKTKNLAQKESLIYRLHPSLEHGRLIFQLGTSSPTRAVEAARLVAADVVGIDINAGCPKPFSTSGGMGAALLRTPDLLCSILEALVKEISPEFGIGISVKIRLLETPELTANLVNRLCETGITGLTIHCRTTPMRPRERAIRDQLRMIADICHDHGVACLVNGDVESREHAMRLIEEFPIDGAMLATSAESNPSCFRPAVEGGLLPWRTIITDYMSFALDVENRFGNTKFTLGNLIPGKSVAYRKVTASKSYTDVCSVPELELDHLLPLARVVDERLGIKSPDDCSADANAVVAAVAKAQGTNASARAAGGDMRRLKSPPAMSHQHPHSLAPQPTLSPSSESSLIGQTCHGPASLST